MPPRPRERRDCRCPRARHQHGTYLAYLSDNCRCLPCTAAWVRKSTDQRRIVQAKSWGQPDTRPHTFVSAGPTALRLRALAVLGYGCPELAARYGLSASTLAEARSGVFPAVRRQTAEAVARMYDDLWDTRSTNPRAGQTISRATKHGWLPPLALDDDTIDDPAARPQTRAQTVDSIDEVAVSRAMQGDSRVRLTIAEKSVAVARLTAWGYSAAEIAERLRISGRTVVRKRSAA